MDVRLSRWLWPEDAPSELQPLLVAAEQDAWRTRNCPLHESALSVVADGDPRQAPVLDLAAAPPVDDPLRWSHFNSDRDCVDAIDAARSWLTRHGDELTVGQLAATARAALAITHYVGHVHVHLSPAGSQVATAVVAAARPWRGALQAVAELRSPVPASLDHSTLTVAVGGAATWLRGRLRPEGQWPGPASWAGGPADREAWRDVAESITARMPDVADLLHKAIGTVHAHGGVLAATGLLKWRPGQLVRVPEWAPAPVDHRSYRALDRALRTAALKGRELAAVVGARPRPGLDDARIARGQASTAASNSAANLARQWYPQRAYVAEPGVPSTTSTTRPSRQRQSSPRRGR